MELGSLAGWRLRKSWTRWWLVIIITVCLVALAAAASVGATDIELGKGNFDYDTGGWTLFDGGAGDIRREQTTTAFQPKGVRIYGSGAHSLSKSVSTEGYSTIQVTHWTNGVDLEKSDTFQAQWSGDGGETWNTFQTLTGNVYDNGWRLQRLTLVGAGDKPEFAVRFVFDGSDGGDVWYIDEVMVLGDGQILEYGDFGETFEGWTALDAGGGALSISQRAGHDFDVHANNSGPHRLHKNINTTGLLNLQLSYYVRGDGLESNDTFLAEWSADGGVHWHLIENLDGDAYEGSPTKTWRQRVFSLPTEAANNPNFVLSFTFDGDHSSDHWYIDQIEVNGDVGAVSGLSLTSDSPTILGNPTTFGAHVQSGQVIRYDWDFGDGSPVVTTTGPVVTHVYAEAGGRTATVTAYAPLNSQSAATVVDVRNVPIAGLTLTQDGPALVGQPTAFKASIVAGTNVAFTWDFDDGTPPLIDGPDVTHVYTVADIYTVSVVAANTENSLSADVEVVIEPVPAPDFQWLYLPLVAR